MGWQELCGVVPLQLLSVLSVLSCTLTAGLNQTSIQVLPEPVQPASVRITGFWDNFTLLWQPSSVNHGKVFYELSLQYETGQTVVESSLSEPRHQVENIKPYTQVNVSVRAYTYWGSARATQVILRTPMSVPSSPYRPRGFVTYTRKPLSKAYKVRLEFRWNRPRQPNGKIQAYNVYQSDSLAGPWQKKHMYMRGHVTVDPAKVKHVYYFKVDACTVIGCSNATAPVHINTAEERPVPRLLMTTGKAIKVNFVDDHLTLNIINASASSLTFIAQEHVYYWLEANKIMELDTGQKRQVASLKGKGLSLAVDWISRTLYWTARVSGEEYYAVYQYKMDQNDGWGKKIITADGRLDKVAVDPYDKTLYWTETLPGSGTQVMAASIDKPDMVRKVFNRANGTGDKRQRREIDASCTCVSLSLSPTFVIDHSDRDNLRIFVVEDISGNIWAADMNGCMCRLVVNASRPGIRGLPPDSLTVDESRVFWSSASSRIIASADKFTGKILEVQTLKEPPVNIVAFGEHLQPMPDPSCLKVVGQYNNVSMERGKTNQSLTLALWPWQPPALPQCVNISSPTVKYTLHFRRIRSYDRKDCGSPGVHCDTQSTYQLESTLRGLEPFSLYQVQVSVSNFFTETYGPGQDAGSLGPSAIFRTQEGVPSRARNVTAIPETPTQVMVQWRLPAHPHGHPPDLYYQIRAKAVASSGQAVHSQESGMRAGSKVCNFTRAERVNPDQMIHPEKVLCRLKVVKLASKQTYQFTVSTYEKTRTYSSVTDPIVATTYQYPGPITLMQATNHNITIKWVSPSDDGVYRHNIEYTPSQANDWSPMRVETTRNATVYINSLHDLPPNKEYAFRVNVIYKSFETFTWPKGNEKPYRFSTLVAVPSRPDMPHIIQTKGGAYKVTWDVPENGGTAVDHYSLVYRTPDNFNWTQAYNGTGTQWVVEGLVGGKAYSFRVAAKNTEGWSPYSANTSFLIIKTIEPGTYKQDQLTIVLGSTLSVIIIIIAACCIVLAIVYRQRSEHKGIPAELVAGLNRHSPDLELATLRELPRNHIQAANALYAINIIPTDEDIAALPHYRRDQLTLTKFLGSGAFGEVFEGLARNILSEDSGETNVAVKTLRKGATDTEKEEFLKEALLMSNFKHEHILRLLGVCLDNDPQFIILELMEGGDLLSYLRASRPSSQVEARLSLPDMVGICLDVALGCQYLEDMHFVHRDLAARNCLVSTADNRVRSVKIGDFGLARDIYNNDYYRKEGEGLLPVRWMSPESLVDGVFTTQSDVWAFGILMWETLTFGQQPYPARTNIEVLHFVRSGGRLDRPNNCPDDLYHLMLKCWAFTPDDRPSFHFIAEQLESFKSRSADPNSDFAARWSYGNADDGLGGSVKLSPGSKKKRLQKLLGSSSTEEMSSDQQCSLMTTGQPPAADSSTSGGMMPRRGSTDSLDSLGYMRPLKSPPANYLEILPDPDSVSAPPRINIQKHKPKNASTRNKENSGQKTPPGGHQNQLNYAHVGGTSSQCDMDTDNSAVMLPPAKTSSPKSSNKKTPQSECTGELNYAHLGVSNNQCDMDTDNSAVMLPPAKSSSPKTSTRPSESDYADIIRVSDCDRVDNKQQRPVRPSDRNNGGARTKWPPTNRKSNSNRNESVNYSPLANLSPVNCNVDTNSKPVTPHSVNPSPSQTSYASVSPRPTLNGHAPGHSTSHSSPNTSLSSQQPGQPSGSTLVPQSTDKGLAKGTRSTPTNGLTVQGWPDFGDSRV